MYSQISFIHIISFSPHLHSVSFGKDDMSEAKLLIVNELHKPARKNYPRRKTIIKGLDDLWQTDLADFRAYAKENGGFSMILVVIDCFSKYLWCRPLKTKTAEEVSKAFKDILLQSNRIPGSLQSDQGAEFFNNKFQKLMQDFSINHYNTYSIMKASMAERVIRTLKGKLFKYFSLNGTYKWIDVLQEITEEYNNTRHRTIGLKPCEVNKSNENEILTKSYNRIKIAGPNKLKVGDITRISKVKHVFEKGYTPNWTTELFKIVKVNITNPVTYMLEDMDGNPIKGAFYEHELQKTVNPDVYLVEKVLKRKGRKIYVRWLGFDKKHDSWIDSSNVL